MIQIYQDLCSGCGTCVEVCPAGAIHLDGGFAQVNPERCTGCWACVQACPNGAIEAVPEPVQAEAVLEPAVRGQAIPAAARPQEIIPVHIPPPPTVIYRPPSLAQQLLPPLGAALAFLGREIAPRLLRLASERVQGQNRYLQESSPRGTGRQSGRGGGGQRWRRQRRGRR